MNEFPNQWWTKSSISRLLKKLRDTGTVNKLTGSGQRSAAHKKNVDLVNYLVLSQDDTRIDTPQTHDP